MAGDLGDVFICERNLVTAISGTNQVSQIFGALQACGLANFFHSELCALFGVDFASDGGISYDFSLFVKNDCLSVGGTYVASAKVFHVFSSHKF